MATYTVTASTSTTMAQVSQLSCYSSMSRHGQLLRRTFLFPMVRRKSFVVMSLDRNSSETTSSEERTSLSYAAEEVSDTSIEGKTQLYPTEDENATSTDEPAEEPFVTQQKKGAKIHDFCFGIPYGGLILSGGLIGSIFSRNLTTLGTGVFFGVPLLTLSTMSLKVWRQGKSSFPFILGQAVLSAILFWKNFGAFSLTKRLLPSGFYAAISAAMLCFYTYVVLSGGNPPPKKLQPSAAAS